MRSVAILNGRCRPAFLFLMALTTPCGAQVQAKAPTEQTVRADRGTGQSVRVEQGRVAGRRDGNVVRFLGLPFAAPPVGARRWRPPALPGAWSGVRDATRFGPACPQPVSADTPAFRTSEDCLFLNVWAPARRSGGPFPVLMWIHGGGWVGGTGADPAFDGSAFARKGVIVVTVNYRLGALGFFGHPALTREAGLGAPLANYGLMDNIAALQWLRRNVAAIGGDPARITVAGESAGAAQVMQLLTVPAARGLFAQAIVESGPASSVMPDLADAEAAGTAAATRLGLPATVDAGRLRAVPVSDLLNAAPGGAPVLDGRLVAASPLSRLIAGDAARVPLLIGTNANEGSLVPYYGAAATMVTDMLHPWAGELSTIYRADAADPEALRRDLFADVLFAAPARRIAAVHSAEAPTFLYHFDGISHTAPDARYGAPHGAEMVYVFDTLATMRRPVSDPDRPTAMLMHRCWLGFVRTGRPDCGTSAPWPAYRPESDDTMVFAPGGQAAARAGYEAARLDFIDQHVLAPTGSGAARHIDGVADEQPRAGDIANVRPDPSRVH